ncbi:MAG: N-acetylmuramoyl-L-alanine amidase [Nitrospinae bacterium]|nr:N-acetylmuramoyl-L-alanine amidase [Nitrospinota bacterium]
MTGVVLCFGTAFSGHPNTEAMYKNAKQQYLALFSSPKKISNRAEWESVISRFKLIVKTNSSSPRADDALYTIGVMYKNLYRRSGSLADKNEAIGSFNTLASRYPKSSLAGEARKQVGDIEFMARNNTKAKYAYKSAMKQKVDSRYKVAKAQNAPLETSIKSQALTPARKPDEQLAAKKPEVKGDGAQPVATLTNVRRYSTDGYTRVVLDFSDRTAFRVEPAGEKGKVYIDLMDTSLASNLSPVMAFDNGLAKGLKVGNGPDGVKRVTLDMDAGAESAVMALNSPFRIVIDLNRAKPMPAVAMKGPEPQPKPSMASSSVKPATTVARGGSLRTIVIDAGHGGKDPGAIGPTGLMEKDVALAIAKKLKTRLENRLRCKVVLTRSTDRFLELDERTVFANSVNADLFVSIHLNASRDSRAKGVETYFLSPARSKDELETAARENMIAHGGRNEIENDITYIMSDLQNTQKVNDSSTLAGVVQRSVVGGLREDNVPVKDKGVKQAMFYVLWRASMPSVLVETGFISNREEERRFRDGKYLDTLADSIAEGLEKYDRTYMVAARE